MVFEVNRRDLRQTRVTEEPPVALEPGLVDHSAGWLRVEHRLGPDGIEGTYRDLLEGRADPAAGFICAMHTNPLS